MFVLPLFRGGGGFRDDEGGARLAPSRWERKMPEIPSDEEMGDERALV